MKTIKDIEFLINSLADKIANKFIDRIKSDYKLYWENNDENPYTSFINMVNTEFLAMGCDHYDFSYDLIDEFLELELGEEFEEIDETWRDSDHPTYYRVSEFLYQRFIDPKLTEIVSKEENNEND